MKIQFKFIRLTYLKFLLGLVCFAMCSICSASDSFNNYFDRGRLLHQSIGERNPSWDIKFFIPDQLSYSDKESDIANQIFSHTLKNWFKELTTMKNEAALMVREVEKAVSPKFEIRTSANSLIKHTVNLKFVLWKQELFIRYKGLANVDLKFDVADYHTSVYVYENLSPQLKVGYSHDNFHFGHSDLLKLEYVF